MTRNLERSNTTPVKIKEAARERLQVTVKWSLARHLKGALVIKGRAAA